MVYAGFWLRAYAFVVDWMIVQFASIVCIGLPFTFALQFGLTGESDEGPRFVAAVLYVAAHLLYWSLLESSPTQATLGKMAVGARVTDLEGRRIGFGRALCRTLAKVLSTALCLLGYVMAAFMPRKQALHDLLCGTLVMAAVGLPPPSAGATKPKAGVPSEHPTPQ